VLLLIHGIIGNTDGIVQGLKLARDADGETVDQKFDLVLTYDYENLSTPIAETAVKLKQQLADAGLRDGDDKCPTLLVHSMGGLVSRWFIEREGGNRVVDHLVMFGTPNAGSPLGKVDMARRRSFRHALPGRRLRHRRQRREHPQRTGRADAATAKDRRSLSSFELLRIGRRAESDVGR
jgi:triacylglycerol esterase/lipase EstA (alpha/beta hydrolase family)